MPSFSSQQTLPHLVQVAPTASRRTRASQNRSMSKTEKRRPVSRSTRLTEIYEIRPYRCPIECHIAKLQPLCESPSDVPRYLTPLPTISFPSRPSDYF